MTSEHPPVIEAGLNFLRQNSLWPGHERPSVVGGVYQAPDDAAKKLEKFLDSMPVTGGWSGGEFQHVMGEIVRRRRADPGAPQPKPGFLSRLFGS